MELFSTELWHRTKQAADRYLARLCRTRRLPPVAKLTATGKVRLVAPAQHTMCDEWIYSRPFTSGQDRATALPVWLHTYNYHRSHTALAGQPPITRVNNGPGHYS